MNCFAGASEGCTIRVMKLVYNASIDSAQQYLEQATDQSHDASHGYRVAYNVRQIARGLDYQDPEFLEVCAWWHDVGRIYTAPNHEELSARMLWADLNSRAVDEATCLKAYEAIRFHRFDMHPRTLEGKIIRDADKLDFLDRGRWSKGIEAQEWQSLQTKASLLPHLREMLELEESKRLYDGWVGEFRSFIKLHPLKSAV